MGFSSISFLFYFLPPFFLVYYLVPRRPKNIVALLGSLAFYAWGEPTCFLLIAAATLANYGLGLWMRRARRLGLASFAGRSSRSAAPTALRCICCSSPA